MVIWKVDYILTGEDGGLPDEFAKWKKADLNFDKKLDVTEFLYFQHPEYNPNTIKNMAADMMVNFDKNNDKVRSYCIVDNLGLSLIIFRFWGWKKWIDPLNMSLDCLAWFLGS